MSVCEVPLRPWLPTAVNSGMLLPATVQKLGPKIALVSAAFCCRSP
jgi:hypothetical protein